MTDVLIWYAYKQKASLYANYYSGKVSRDLRNGIPAYPFAHLVSLKNKGVNKANKFFEKVSRDRKNGTPAYLYFRFLTTVTSGPARYFFS